MHSLIGHALRPFGCPSGRAIGPAFGTATSPSKTRSSSVPGSGADGCRRLDPLEDESAGDSGGVNRSRPSANPRTRPQSLATSPDHCGFRGGKIVSPVTPGRSSRNNAPGSPPVT